MARWTADNIPDQSGRVAIVTGANTGIGFETARTLAQRGATVILACRNQQKGQAAVERIRGEDSAHDVSLALLDLADLDNVRSFSERFRATHSTLDLLILNAGVMVPPASKTAQGFELQFGVNHLGHFALAGALLPALRAASAARVVVVSSVAAQQGAMNFDDLHFEARGYAPWQAYGQSKLANQLFVRELQRRLDEASLPIRVTAAHPGWTATDLQRTSGMARFFNPIFAMKPPQGALPTLRAATDPDASGTDYFGPSGWMQMRGYPIRVPMVKQALRDSDATRLWEVSESLTSIRYDLSA